MHAAKPSDEGPSTVTTRGVCYSAVVNCLPLRSRVRPAKPAHVYTRVSWTSPTQTMLLASESTGKPRGGHQAVFQASYAFFRGNTCISRRAGQSSRVARQNPDSCVSDDQGTRDLLKEACTPAGMVDAADDKAVSPGEADFADGTNLHPSCCIATPMTTAHLLCMLVGKILRMFFPPYTSPTQHLKG